jgi:repressor of nif and glnA expression
MVKNTYDHLEFALKEKGFWTPADEIRPAKGALMEFPGLENSSRKGVSERMTDNIENVIRRIRKQAFETQYNTPRGLVVVEMDVVREELRKQKERP